MIVFSMLAFLGYVAYVLGKRMLIRKRCGQIRQLKQIYLYLLMKETERKSCLLEDGIKVDGNWIYTKDFYFNMENENAIEKVKMYLAEYLYYFMLKAPCRQVDEEIISLYQMIGNHRRLLGEC